jgi:Flp pilus assembly protein RcpC/CpaB
MGRRTLLLVASVLISAIGVGMIGLYVKDADRRAEARAEAIYGPRPTPTPTPTPTEVSAHDDIAHRGLTIEVAESDRAIGLLQPGDRVAVYETAKSGTTTQIIDTIKVIGVGGAHDVKAAKGETVPGSIVALDATPTQAVTILQAQAGDRITLVVLGRAG